MPQHRSPAEDHEYVERTDEHRIVRRRKTDIDKIARINSTVSRYKIFWYPLLAIAAGAGFGIVTPRQTANQLQAQITGNFNTVVTRIERVEARQDSLHDTHREINESLKLVVRYICLKSTNTERAMMGLEGCIR